MDIQNVVEQLKHLSNPERLVIIGEATRLIQDDLSKRGAAASEEDPILKLVGCLSGEPISAAEIEKDLYGGE